MDDKQCLLVIMGATADGVKELVAIEGGFRESELSWKQLAIRSEIQRPDHRSTAGDWRRGAGFLESVEQSL